MIPARNLWSGQNARGLGAGAGIAVLRGLRAEGGPTSTIDDSFVDVVGKFEPKAR